MDHQGVFRLRAALLFAVLIPALSLDTTTEYFKSGGSVAFTPAPVSVPITSVAWKLNGDVVAEWVKDIVPVEYYGVLKDHGKLNVESGELSIEKMTQVHEGVYTVEINSRFLPGDFKAELVKELPHPGVAVQPPSCNSRSKACDLNCLGDTREAGPVTFYWKVGDGEWKKSSAVLNIYNQEESKRPQTYACRMVNPVSQRDSKPISDPFSRKSPPLGPKEKVGVIFGVILILVVIVGVVTYLYRHREPFKGCWNKG